MALHQISSQRVSSVDTKQSTSERTQQAHVCSDPWTSLQQLTNCIVAIIHAIVFLVAVGYAQNYYFHLRNYPWPSFSEELYLLTVFTRTPQEQRSLKKGLGIRIMEA